MGLLSSFAYVMIESVFVTGALIVILGLLPTTTVFPSFPLDPVAYTLPNFTIHYDKWNDILGAKAKLLLQNQVAGPESLAIRDGLLYTGLNDGRLVEIDLSDGKVREVTRFAPDNVKNCEDDVYYRLDTCGRPLGLRFDNRGYLTVVDAFYGLFRVNATTGHKKSLGLGTNDKNMPDALRGLYNDFVFDPTNQNIVYVTVSSTKWGLHEVPWSLNEHENTGLLLAVEMRSGKVIKLTDGLYFANGVEISADDKYLLYSQCTNYTISKIDLESARKALSTNDVSSIKPEIFTANLPGEPDNIRLHDGNILVGIAIGRTNDTVYIKDYVAGVPIVRKAVARLVYLTSVVLDFVRTTLWSHPAMEEVVFKLKSGHLFYHGLPMTSAVVVVDGTSGNIKTILGSKHYNAISEAIIDESTGDLYFGSFKNRFIGKLLAADYKKAIEK